MAESDSFLMPDYQGSKMTIIDACPTRNQDRIHLSVRVLAEKMNISIIESAKTKRKSTCCGDTNFGKMPTEQVVERMSSKAGELTEEDVLVYCVSCSRSMFNGGKQPRYLIDLLFSEDTAAGIYHPDKWHRELDEYIEDHREYEIVHEQGQPA